MGQWQDTGKFLGKEEPHLHLWDCEFVQVAVEISMEVYKNAEIRISMWLSSKTFNYKPKDSK